MAITVVMYHYVRKIKQSRFPEIKGLEIELFEEQIHYLRKHYQPIKIETLIEAINDDRIHELPENALLLTFDDGYADHFTNAFPLLHRLGLQGAFYITGKAIEDGEVLDVNKIHFLLASVSDKEKIIRQIEKELNTQREQYALEPFEYYYQKYAQANRFDNKDVIFIKRILQKGLPEIFRKELTASLFSKFVSADEKAFAAELYLSKEQILCMMSCGMHIGSHSYDHYWLNALDQKEQSEQVSLSLNFLRRLGVNTDYWTMCYPYGGYDNSLLNILCENGCQLGFTMKVNSEDTSRQSRLTFPRLDTNDFPKERNASWKQPSDLSRTVRTGVTLY